MKKKTPGKNSRVSKQHGKRRHVSKNTVTWARIKNTDIKKDKKHGYIETKPVMR